MKIKVLLICGVLLGLPYIVASQTKRPSLPAFPSHEELTSPEVGTRISAFAKLIGVDPSEKQVSGLQNATSILRSTLLLAPEQADARKLLLIELLENENRIVDPYRNQPGLELSEGYGDYYEALVSAVSSLKDIRSMNVLLGGAFLSGGMATGALLSFGPALVDPIISKTKDPDLLVRATAAQMFGLMLDRSDIANDVQSKSKLRSALIQASMDADFLVRKDSIDGLIKIGDAKCISIVEELSRNDPYRADFVDNRYLVREAAAKALQSRTKK